MAVDTSKTPWGILFLGKCWRTNWTPETRIKVYKIAVLFLTFWTYTFFHMSRKAISVVKPVFLNCTEGSYEELDEICTSFINEINGTLKNEATLMESYLDTSFLFSYAFFMFVSGFVAERMDLRYFLSIGMIMSGIFVFLLGFAKVMNVHSIGYFIGMQILGGAFQTTGWPGVVTVVANWFGKGKKGLIFGIWNAHTSVGNILGGILAGVWVDDDWSYSFIVPGTIIAVGGLIIWLFLVPKPEDINLSSDSSVYQRSANDTSALGESTPLLQSPEFSESEDEELNHSSFEPEPEVSITVPEANSSSTLGVASHSHDEEAISFIGALKIPGVIEFSLCLFFAKLVSYTFLYWLPQLISEAGIDASTSGYLSTLFDVGGILGGILAGLATDITGKPASTCAVMLVVAIPMLLGYHSFADHCKIHTDDHGDVIHDECFGGTIGLLLLLGLLVNGPYALITTAVSAELGTHPSLQGSSKALATVTAIIDGTGSIGAAVGPFIAGALEGGHNGIQQVFVMMMIADGLALLFLARLVYKDIQAICQSRRERQMGEMYIDQQRRERRYT